MVPPSDTDPPSKVAATVMRQPFILGSFRVALPLGARGPAWLTAFPPAVTVMVVAGMSRPFTTATAGAARGLDGFTVARRSGEGAGVTVGAVAADGFVGVGWFDANPQPRHVLGQESEIGDSKSRTSGPRSWTSMDERG